LDQGLGLLTDRDIPLYGGLDTVKLTAGTLAEAEHRMARYYGADWCRFSVGGSTHANQSLCLAIGQPGDTVIVTRSLHRSLLIGFVLAGLNPVWLPTEIDGATGLPVGVSIESVGQALDDHPEAVAVMLTEPSYLGTMSDLKAIVELVHDRSVPVIVDQAWGAHFGSHPEIPDHAMALGADALVTSTHKLLLGVTQASIVVANTDVFDVDRLERGFEATHTTSPSGVILAGSDASRALMETRGHDLMGETIALVRYARERLRQEVPDVGLPDETAIAAGRFDPTRFIIQLAPLGADGVSIEHELNSSGISFELVDRDTILALITVGDTKETVDALLDALVPALLASAGPPRHLPAALSWRVTPITALSPRVAYFSAHERVAAIDAIGRVSAELIAPYPPGVPVLAPGEVITKELLDGLRDVAGSGVRIAYAADPTLETLEVVASSSTPS
jgi:lysine decarboxylase